ncbi:MAG TPA: family 16 glycoside hydrolase [Gemmata sp.]|jgi:putative heme-binding domain-containing protein|nr:family 16 glycoside hydrolase [Gemmata sp.]
MSSLNQELRKDRYLTKPLPNWLSLLGLATLAMAALAVVLAVLVGVRWLTILFAAVGLVLVSAGIWKNRKRAQLSIVGTLILGGTLCAAIVALSLFLPGVLNSFWAMDGQLTETETDRLVVVPREQPRDDGRPLAENDWVDSASEGIRQDDLFVHVESAKIGQLPERGPAHFLLVHYHIVQFRPGRDTRFERYLPGQVTPTLTDESGQVIQFVAERVKKPPSKFDVLLKVDHLLIFEQPPPGIRELKLELPASAWGRAGTCRFRIEHIGREEPSSNFASLIAQTKSMLQRKPQVVPDPVLGRTLFVKNCQECHTLYGFGGKVGPDLTTSKRDDLNFLLTSIIDPSAVIEKPYIPTLITTTSGLVYNGIVKQMDEHVVTLLVPNRLVAIPRDEIETMKESKISLMPADLLKTLTEHEVRSLIAYLTGKSQMPLLATPDNAPYFFFYEKNLSDWTSIDSIWAANDGVIVSPGALGGKPGLLVSQLQLAADFHMSLRFQSGADVLGAVILGDARQPRNGQRIEFTAGKPLNFVGFEKGTEIAAPIVSEQWNKLEVIVAASRIRVRLNDTDALDTADLSVSERRVFALEGSRIPSQTIQFRNLDLRLLLPNK